MRTDQALRSRGSASDTTRDRGKDHAVKSASHLRHPVSLAGAAVAIVVTAAGCGGSAPVATPAATASVMPSATVAASSEPGGSSSVSPTASESPRSFESLPAGTISAGTYTLSVAAYDVRLPRALTFTLPAGWEKYEGGLPALLKNGAEPPHGMGVTFWTVDDVIADPCKPDKGTVTPPVGPTVDDLATALTTVPRYTATQPENVTIGAVSGKYLELTADEDAAGCTDNAFKLWTSSGREFGQGPGQRNLIWILDVDGTRFVISAFHYADAAESALAELRAVIGSIEFAQGS